MACILNIETTTKNCSVALGIDGEIRAVKEVEEAGYSHAENLNPFIQEVLKEAGIDTHKLEAIAVSKGPGSYTGLRIGTSTAKGLCYGLDIPLIATDPLEGLVRSFVQAQQELLPEPALLVPMLDARRMEVFTAFWTPDIKPTQDTHALIVGPEAFDAFRDHTCFLFGDGAGKFQETFAEREHVRIVEGLQTSAKPMVRMSEDKFNGQEWEDLAYFEPFYLKDFIATTPKKLV